MIYTSEKKNVALTGKDFVRDDDTWWSLKTKNVNR